MKQKINVTIVGKFVNLCDAVNAKSQNTAPSHVRKRIGNHPIVSNVAIKVQVVAF
jgi:hypothetical protein